MNEPNINYAYWWWRKRECIPWGSYQIKQKKNKKPTVLDSWSFKWHYSLRTNVPRHAWKLNWSQFDDGARETSSRKTGCYDLQNVGRCPMWESRFAFSMIFVVLQQTQIYRNAGERLQKVLAHVFPPLLLMLASYITMIHVSRKKTLPLHIRGN